MTTTMQRFQPLLFQPVPSVVGFPLSELLEQVRGAYFPEIEGELEVRIADEGPLAFIQHEFMGRGSHLVVFHPVLNHPGTPIEVLRFIAKHELTHAVRRGRIIAGRYETHPPEFWAHERAVGPETHAVWAWVRHNLGPCLRRSPLGLRVTGRWRALRDASRGPYTPALPFNGEDWTNVCPGDGAQLRLPPSWAVRPLPFQAPNRRNAGRRTSRPGRNAVE